MKTLSNADGDTLFAFLQDQIGDGVQLDVAVPQLSVFAVEVLGLSAKGVKSRLMLPAGEDLALLGDDKDRLNRVKLNHRHLSQNTSGWLRDRTEVRRADKGVPQGIIVVRESGKPRCAIVGSFALSTEGVGLAPGNPLSFIQVFEGDEATAPAQWFDQQWNALPPMNGAAAALADQTESLVEARAPRELYSLMLHHLLGAEEGGLDEEQIVNAATGIKNTSVWQMLYRFQRDGVIGAADKLARHGGCILADSVGLGKTFEALAVIKYHELRNDRVLVLCPKRLRDNWTVHTINDKRNRLSGDRFNYDVLHHTDLSRARGKSGDIDLAHLNWANYDLIVIDESHNFRNKRSPKKGVPTRYDRLMEDVIRSGVKTRVLMLSATPVNNRLADLRNQIAFAVAGDDYALSPNGISSLKSTTRLAQQQFNAWLALPEEERTPGKLVDMLGFAYFKLLDLLTIARSRRHIERYYGTAETGKFPDRLKPINVKADIDTVPPDAGGMPHVADLNRDISLLNLAAYSPLKYLLPGKIDEYEAKYSTETSGGTIWRQFDREASLTSLMRVNVLKRLESSVQSFGLTLNRQLGDVGSLIGRIDTHEPGDVESPSITEIDLDDPIAEELAVGKNIKVLLSDMDLIKWRHDLAEDRDRLQRLADGAEKVTPDRDAKLESLKAMLEHKWDSPINDGNRKVIVFTAFADTAVYLYDQLHQWAKDKGIESGLLTGGNENRSTLGHTRTKQADILTAFAPVAKQRPDEFAHEGNLDLLIATDCISEGQNLQDCDWLINYDIHWNPVRIIQRFGRIDRLGSPNARIQLANFWPNMQIDEYLDLEQRVSGKMVLLDVSATGEENVFETSAGDPMNDLDYRRRQLLKLQDAVIDIDDLSAGVSIADLTLSDYRVDLADYERANPGKLAAEPFGTFAATFATADVPPGYVFCLRSDEDPTEHKASDYPLAPHYAVHVSLDGSEVLLNHKRTRPILDALKTTCGPKAEVDTRALAAFDRLTKNGKDMSPVTKALASATAAVSGLTEQHKAAGLFTPGANATVTPDATSKQAAKSAGEAGFEVLAYLAILPPDDFA
jgi:hypothetical protein